MAVVAHADGAPVAANDPPGVAAVEFDQVSLVSQGQTVLDELSFTLPPGRLVVIVGGNGAGKSALLKAIVEGPPLEHGRIRLFGREAGDPACRRRISWLPDHAQIGPWVPRHDEPAATWRGIDLLVSFGTRFGSHWTRDQARERLARHRLDSRWLDEAARRLSPGSIRELALAAAMASDRDLLLLDEPFAGLDPLTRDHWADALGRLVRHEREQYEQALQGRTRQEQASKGQATKEQGGQEQASMGQGGHGPGQPRTVLVATRSLAGLEAVADRILLLVDGCLSFDGLPATLAAHETRRKSLTHPQQNRGRTLGSVGHSEPPTGKIVPLLRR